MNIALFSDTYPPHINGVAVSTQNLFKILRKNGHNAYVVTTNAFSDHLEYQDGIIRIPGIELKKLYGYRMSGFYNSRALRIIQSWKLDLVHLQTEAGIGIFGKIVARRNRLPTISTYHTMYEDYTHYAVKGPVDRFAKTLVRGFSKYIAMQCTEFITPSIKTKDAIRRYGADRYINVVPTGIDFSKFSKENIDIIKCENLKTKYDLHDKFVIVSVGRVAKEKSIDVLLKGYANFIHEFQIPSKFIIVGDGPSRFDLEILVSELKINEHVVFIGAVSSEEVPIYYHLGDAYVSASITETQGLTFMEAMASRLVVLARYDENLIDTIVDQKTGYFYEDKNDFAHKLNMIVNLPDKTKKRLLDNALDTVEAYSIDRFYENIMEVYNRAIRQHW
jgi:1,2-diacylglycerol 3-alpha-glucosyltransferase